MSKQGFDYKALAYGLALLHFAPKKEEFGAVAETGSDSCLVTYEAAREAQIKPPCPPALPVSIPSGNGTVASAGALTTVPEVSCGCSDAQVLSAVHSESERPAGIQVHDGLTIERLIADVDKAMSKERIDFEMRLQHRTREEL